MAASKVRKKKAGSKKKDQRFPTKKKTLKKSEFSSPKSCPVGLHLVRTHPMFVPPSNAFPEGHLTTRHAFCRKNRSNRIIMSVTEINKIRNSKDFEKAKRLPCSIELGFKSKGSQFDPLIAGWVQYWNDIFKPDLPLDPDLIKALIASESGFRSSLLANKNDRNSARGLTQILNKTRIALGNPKGELKDYLIDVTREDLNDPSTNIASGVRWLFQKRKLLTGKMGRQATWEESVAEYKSLTKKIKNNEAGAKKMMDTFKSYFKALKKCGK